MKKSILRRPPGLWLFAIHLLAVLLHFRPAVAASADAPLLTNIVPSAGTLAPAFSGHTYHYGMALPSGTTSFSLAATAAGENATVTVNGTTVTSGTQSVDIPVQVGANTITIQVTAPDGTISRPYRITALLRNASPQEEENLQPLTYPSSFQQIPSNPDNFNVVGGRLFFTAYSSTHGEELWTSDGTEAGTVLVKDITPGSNSSYLAELRVVGDTLYFLFSKEWGGRRDELWKSDGTTAGTLRIMDVHERYGSSSGILEPTVVGSRLYYQMEDAENHRSLWVTDGTQAGTVRVTDLDVSPWYASLTAVGNELYFLSANDLWKTNGTPGGTRLVAHLPTHPGNLMAVEDILYFSCLNNGRLELWKSGGTEADTQMIKDFAPVDTNDTYLGYTAVGTTLYFLASDGSPHPDLWRSDGTPAGTVLLREVIPNASWTRPAYPIASGGIVYFRDESYPSQGLWRTDGTPEGTLRIWEHQPYQLSASTISGSTIYFSASEALWKSDGTAEGTLRVKYFSPGSKPSQLTLIGGTLFFRASGSLNNEELWKSDGTEAGTVMVKDINSGPLPSHFSDLTAVGDRLYFQDAGRDWVHLWRSDGTAHDTNLIRRIPASSDYGRPSTHMAAVGETLYLQVRDVVYGTTLWKSDGTAEGTVDLGFFPRKPDSQDKFKAMAAMGGVLYFSFYSDAGFELYKTDGTRDGTSLIKTINGGPGSGRPSDLVVIGDTLYFSAPGDLNSPELWKSDGTEEGTTMIDIDPDNDWDRLDNLTVAGGALYFCASDAQVDSGLWKTDGTAGGTVLVKDLGEVTPVELKTVGSTLYFQIHDPLLGRTLWKSDGTGEGTLPVRTMSSVGDTDSIHYLGVVGDTLYFRASDPAHGAELWKTDGTDAGTVMVADINHGTASGSPSEAVVVNGFLYFQATDGIHGSELWKSDGTAEGTMMIRDIAEGADDSAPGKLTLIGTKLHFVATTAAGAQIFLYDTARERPIIRDPKVYSIGKTYASLGGHVIASGTAPLSVCGIIYAPAVMNPEPRFGTPGAEFRTINGTFEEFEIPTWQLIPGTAYAYRIYATNAHGTAFSVPGAFATLSNFTPVESWRDTFFFNHENTGTAADLADPDGDGIVNLLERAFRLHPLTPGTTTLVPGTGTSGLPSIATTTGGATGPALAIQYIRLKSSTSPGLTYVPQFGSDPGAPWQDFTGIETVESIDAEWERVTVEDTTPNQPARFGRVSVTTAP